MFEKIMAPVDLAHIDRLTRALDVAAALGRQHGCPVCYVGVTSPQPGAVGRSPEDFARKLAEFAAGQAAVHGHKAESHAVTSHDPSIDLDDALLKAAKAVGADLIVMASHIPGLADHLWPSHGGSVARRAAASVFVVR